MGRQEWIARCSARLHEQWPTVPEEQLAEVALEIQRRVQRQLESQRQQRWSACANLMLVGVEHVGRPKQSQPQLQAWWVQLVSGPF
jgi:hypothetical protein